MGELWDKFKDQSKGNQSAASSSESLWEQFKSSGGTATAEADESVDPKISSAFDDAWAEVSGSIAAADRQRVIDEFNAGGETGFLGAVSRLPRRIKEGMDVGAGYTLNLLSGGMFQDAIGYDAEKEGRPYIDDLAERQQESAQKDSLAAGDSFAGQVLLGAGGTVGEVAGGAVVNPFGGAVAGPASRLAANSTGLIRAAAATAPSWPTIWTTFGPQYYQQAKTNGASETGAIASAVMKSSIDMVLGIAGGAVASKFGAKTVDTLLGPQQVETLAGRLLGPVVEAGEETIAEYGQALTDYISGLDPNAIGKVEPLRVALTAGLIGAAAQIPDTAVSGIPRAFLASPSRSNARKAGIPPELANSKTQREAIAEQATNVLTAEDFKRQIRALSENDGPITKTQPDYLIRLTEARANAAGETLGEYVGKRLKGVERAQWADYEAKRQGRRGDDVTQVMSAGQRDLGQPAYHGSPYKFDKFTLDKIGTGEGAQAYGWGLYFAGEKQVADFYKNKLSEGVTASPEALAEYFQPGRLVNGYGGKDRVVSFQPADESGRWSVTVQRVDENGNAIPGEPPRTHATQPSAKDMKAAGVKSAPGALYKVDLKPTDEELLDWDKPFSEQPQKVRDALKKYLPPSVEREFHVEKSGRGYKVVDGAGQSYAVLESLEEAQLFARRYTEESKSMSGGVAYEYIKQALQATDNGQYAGKRFDQLASEALAEIGIRGIKYKDQSSRGKESGTHNYVIFDDADVVIEDILAQQAPDGWGTSEGGKEGASTGARKGEIEFFADDGRAVIRAFESADLATMVHEMGHLFRRDIANNELRTAESWAGVKDGKWTREAEEKFARGFENYLRTGKHPNPRIRNLFKKFRRWMSEIYSAVTGSPIDVAIPDEMRGVYDSLFGSQAAPTKSQDTGERTVDLTVDFNRATGSPSIIRQEEFDKLRPLPPESEPTTPEPQNVFAEPVLQSAEQSVEESPEATSARKAWMAEDRKRLGLDELPEAERRSWETELEEARAQNIPQNALGIATQIIQEPRALNSTETAGLVIHAAELKNAHEAAYKKFDAENPESADSQLASTELDRIEKDFDILSRALKMSGTEKGRALAAQKLTINRDYSLLSVKARATKAKKTKLSSVESNRLSGLVDDLSGAEARLQRAIQKAQDRLLSLESHLESGTVPEVKPRKTAPRELAELQAQIAAVRRSLQHSEAAKRARLEKTIAKLEERLQNGDYQLPGKAPAPLSPEIERLEFERDKLIREINSRIAELRPTTFRQKLRQPFDLARTIITSLDFPPIFRQGGMISFGNPVRAAKAADAGFTAMFSERAAHKILKEIESRPNAPLYDRAKLYLADLDGIRSQQEEAYVGELANRLPIIKTIKNMSERNYVVFLNRLRADTFDAMVNSLARDGEPTLEEARAIARYINVATGRGDFSQSLDTTMSELAAYFFSPRYVASRFQAITVRPIRHSPKETRMLIAKEYGKMMAGVVTIYSLALLAGAELEDDGKLKIGNTRVDLMFGMVQTSRLLNRIGTGVSKTVGSWRSGEDRKSNYAEEMTPSRFLRSKLSPIMSASWDMFTGKDYMGNDVTPKSLAANFWTPLSFRDIKKTTEEQGVPPGLALWLVSLFGAGLQTYEDR